MGPVRYAYKFTPVPAQYDLVIRQIKIIIRDLNRKDITFANLHVRVHSTTSASPFWPRNPLRPYYDAKLYTFTEDYTEFPPTGMVCFNASIEGLTSDSVYIKDGKEWMLLRKWLEWRARPSRHTLVGERGYKAQCKWWNLNGKTFRLLDLSKELRGIVFEHALGPRLYPLSTVADRYPLEAVTHFGDPALASAVVHWGRGFYNQHDLSMLYGRDQSQTAEESDREPNLALLRTSKQVRMEAESA